MRDIVISTYLLHTCIYVIDLKENPNINLVD